MKELMGEESVMCLPASVFRFPGYFRIVLTVPLVGRSVCLCAECRCQPAHVSQEKTKEAMARLAAFCQRHAK